MNRDEFKSLYKQAGFKNKNELAKFLSLSHSAINAWGSVTPFPHYIKPLLEYKIKAEAYDKALEQGLIKATEIKSARKLRQNVSR